MTDRRAWALSYAPVRCNAQSAGLRRDRVSGDYVVAGGRRGVVVWRVLLGGRRGRLGCLDGLLEAVVGLRPRRDAQLVLGFLERRGALRGAHRRDLGQQLLVARVALLALRLLLIRLRVPGAQLLAEVLGEPLDRQLIEQGEHLGRPRQPGGPPPVGYSLCETDTETSQNARRECATARSSAMRAMTTRASWRPATELFWS